MLTKAIWADKKWAGFWQISLYWNIKRNRNVDFNPEFSFKFRKFFHPKNLKSESNNPWFKPWFNILLHTQSIVCATVDSQCLEDLGYITLGRVRNSAHLGCQELAVLEICRIHKWTTMNSNLGNRFSPLRKRSFHLFSILLFFPTTATTQEAIVHLVWLIRNYNFGFCLFVWSGVQALNLAVLHSQLPPHKRQ